MSTLPSNLYRYCLTIPEVKEIKRNGKRGFANLVVQRLDQD